MDCVYGINGLVCLETLVQQREGISGEVRRSVRGKEVRPCEVWGSEGEGSTMGLRSMARHFPYFNHEQLVPCDVRVRVTLHFPPSHHRNCAPPSLECVHVFDAWRRLPKLVAHRSYYRYPAVSFIAYTILLHSYLSLIVK